MRRLLQHVLPRGFTRVRALLRQAPVLNAVSSADVHVFRIADLQSA